MSKPSGTPTTPRTISSSLGDLEEEEIESQQLLLEIEKVCARLDCLACVMITKARTRRLQLKALRADLAISMGSAYQGKHAV